MSEKIEISSSGKANIAHLKWLNTDFMAFHLKNYFNDEKLQIVQFEVRPATEDGFASSMFRVSVSFTRQSESNVASDINLIVKIPVSDEIVRTAISTNNVYEKEIKFYSQIAPKIYAALDQLNETKPVIARCYGVCSTNDALFLEDMAIKSYCISSACRGFNFDETKSVLQKLASFHAVNAVLQQNQPNIFENFKYGS